MFWLLVLLIAMGAFFFSMLGLGGAMLYNPLMVWFGYDFKEVVAPTGLLLNGLTALSAAWVYYRKRLVDVSAAFPLTVGAAVGAPAGAYITQFLPTRTLLVMFSGALVLAGTRMLLVSGRSDAETLRGSPVQRSLVAGAVGLTVGAIAGMLGIGGGFLFVPLLLALGYPTKVAAATTSVAVVFSSFTGFLGHIAVGHFDWPLMVAAGIGVLIGSQMGARMMVIRMNPRTLKQMFGFVLLAVAAKLIGGLGG